jgi:hypothetical protein
MGALVTNDNGLPGTSVNLTNNAMEIGLGTKLAVDLGIINTVVIGGWNRLLVCTSTYIQMGTRMDLNLAQTVSVAEGDSWLYSGANNTTYDVASRWGVYLNLFTGGTSKAEKDSRWNEEKQSKMIRSMTIAAFIATIAVSLAGILEPPFKAVGKSVDGGDGVPTVDPVTGETVYDQDNVSGYELNPGGIPVILLEGLTIVCLFVCQLILASKMANNLKDFNAVANLSLAANGLTSAVFSDPDRQPRLFPAGAPMTGGRPSPYDHYRTLGDNISVIREGREFGYFSNGGFEETPSGSSPVATFNMLPGLPTRSQHFLDPEYRDWENLKKGLYPPHDNKPVITLSTELEPYKKTDSLIDMLPHSIVLASTKGNNGLNQGNDQNNQLEGLKFSGISLQTEESGTETIIANADINGNGGVIYMDDQTTLIGRNKGYFLMLCFVKAPVEKQNKGNFDTYSLKVSLDQDKPGKPPLEQNSLLSLESDIAYLVTDNGENGVFINDEAVVIRSGNTNVAKFFPDKIELGGCIFNKTQGAKLGVLQVKADNNSYWPREQKLVGYGQKIDENVKNIILKIRDRIQEAKCHKYRTGGFSGSLNDDTRKNSDRGMANEYYIDDDGKKYINTKIGTFQSGITGILKSLWPLPWYWWK